MNDDNVVEGNENFSLAINMSSLPDHFIPGTVSQATVTIRDDDSKLTTYTDIASSKRRIFFT